MLLAPLRIDSRLRLLPGLVAALLMAAPPAAQAAEPAAPTSKDEPAPARVKKARELWYRGVDAFRNANYEEARVAFAECYQLMPKSDVLRNLSISEIHSGHYVSAARHLKQLLAAPGDLTKDVREEAENRLSQAEAQIGQLEITADIAGAEVLIDGESIGRTPLESNWYVEPGQHEVVVSHEGYPSEERQVFALAGISIPVSAALESLKHEQANDARAAELMGTREGQRSLTGPDQDVGLSTGSTVALITTSTIAALGLAGGVYFTVAANKHESAVDGLAVRLGGDDACNRATQFVSECSRFRREQDSGRRDRQRAAISFIGLGVASAATLGYALWVGLSDDADDAHESSEVTGVIPNLAVGPGFASFSLTTSF